MCVYGQQPPAFPLWSPSHESEDWNFTNQRGFAREGGWGPA